MANVVSFFEIPTKDFERAVEFYNTIFNIEMEVSDVMGYPMAFFPNEGVGVTGALVRTDDIIPTTDGTVMYINVTQSMVKVIKRIEDAGGHLLTPRTKLGPDDDFGYFAVFVDTEGNKIGLHSHGEPGQ